MNEPSPRPLPDTSPDPEAREEPMPAAGHALPPQDWEKVNARAAEILAATDEPETLEDDNDGTP